MNIKRQIYQIILTSLFCLISANTLAQIYRGTLIDAHNQFGCDSEVSDIKRILERSSVDYTLLSARFPCDQNEPFNAHKRVLEVRDALPEKVGFMISTKIGGAGGASNRGYQTLLRADKELGLNSIGFAEILVQHHETNDKNSQFRGMNLSLESPEISRVIDLVLKRAKPIVLHLELNDFKDNAAKSIDDLKKLLVRVDPNPVVLIHIAQLSHTEAENLLRNHKNAYLLLSTVDPLSQRGIEGRLQRGEVAQSGWVNIFDDRNLRYSRRDFESYAARLPFKPEWKNLIETHPEKFLIGIESVYKEPWIRTYDLKVRLWRFALSKLEPHTASRVACGNAKKLWNLTIQCVNSN